MIFSRRPLILIILSLCLVGAIVPALVAGEYAVKAQDVFWLLLAKITGADLGQFSKVQEVIVWNIRLPRMLLALSGGAALAISGAAYQGCFRNPLVEPYILGVSSGAACGAALAIIFPHIFWSGWLTAFVFALGAVFITYSLAKTKGQTPTVTLVLSGIIVGALFTALVGIMKYVADDAQLREITFWMMGGLHYATWDAAALNVLVTALCFIILLALGWRMNLLTLGDQEAKSLGLNPGFTRFVIIITATLCAAVCVASAGIIAWVGLMMPHAARLLLGPDHRWVIPGTALLGAIYLLICDTIARTLTGAEIPIGIITSIIGAPYLLWLLRSKGRSMYGM